MEKLIGTFEISLKIKSDLHVPSLLEIIIIRSSGLTLNEFISNFMLLKITYFGVLGIANLPFV